MSWAASWLAPRGCAWHVPIPLEVVEMAFRALIGYGEVRTAEPLQLRIEGGGVAALWQRIIGEVHALRHVLRHESDLLSLGEKLSGIRSCSGMIFEDVEIEASANF